jgi:hypothetical protein
MASKVYSLPAAKKKTPTVTKRTVGTTAAHPLDGCHVDGVLVETLPPDRKRGLFWKQTDEGIAANAQGKTPPTRGIEMGNGQLAKDLQRKRDFASNENEPWLAPDPMKALASQHVGPGMRPKFLSESRLGKEGNYTRGFEVVRHANGDPVKLGTLVLAQMPEEHAQRRNAHYQGKSESAVKKVYQTAREQDFDGVRGLIRTAKELGMDSPAGDDYYEGAARRSTEELHG